MKKNIVATLVALLPLFMASACAQISIEGKYAVQNISCTHEGTGMADPYPVLFYENWKQNIPVEFTTDSATYISSEKKQCINYQAFEGSITFYFTSGKAFKIGEQNTASPCVTSTTYRMETIRDGYRFILNKGSHLSIIELQKK